MKVQLPEGPEKTLTVAAWPALWEDTREPGVYKLTSPLGKVGFFVARSFTIMSMSGRG